MIPKFPKFALLSIKHKEHLDNHTLPYPPYSDFNFTSLWSWTFRQGTYIAQLDGNLILKFKDYLTNEPFYTFIGTKKISKIIDILLNEAAKDGIPPILKLIPEVTVKAEPELIDRFDIQEDRDHFDYIYSIQEAIDLKGNRYGSKRNFVNRFKKLYESDHMLIDLSDPKTQKQILGLYQIWKSKSAKDPMEIKNELLAIKNLFKLAKNPSLVNIGIYIQHKLIGFSINEILSNGYAINLFEKADTDYKGVFSYLRHITAVYLSKYGGLFLNHEQDLGIPGLRKSKLSYSPKFFLKKYRITHKNQSLTLNKPQSA